MKRITHKEAQQLSASALGSFSYLLPSGEKFTAKLMKVVGFEVKWFIIPAADKLQIKDLQGELVEVV